MKPPYSTKLAHILGLNMFTEHCLISSIIRVTIATNLINIESVAIVTLCGTLERQAALHSAVVLYKTSFGN